MNKETRIFIAGFFWLILGALALAYNINELENGHLAWWKYTFFISGSYCVFKGYRMIEETTDQ
jgi:hypothetical protein